MGQQCPDRSSESLKKGALLMSEEINTKCVLVSPGHNLPSGIRLANAEEIPFSEQITYLDHGVFRIGTCSCGWPESMDSQPSPLDSILARQGKSGFGWRNNNEEEEPYDHFPHKQKHTGCQSIFTVHNFKKLKALLESYSDFLLNEVLLGYPHTRVLREVSTGETFWLKGNDGSVVQNTPVFYEHRGEPIGCMDFRWWDTAIDGPTISSCLTSDGKVLDETV
jgi:hypothetical protein